VCNQNSTGSLQDNLLPGSLLQGNLLPGSLLQGNLLPVCRRDMDERGWDECDFIFVSGDRI